MKYAAVSSDQQRGRRPHGLPAQPGVYLMKDAAGRLLYIGKAANLKTRVGHYFAGALDPRLAQLVRRIARVEYRVTDSAAAALLLEAQLIRRHRPPYNIREKDDKSFLCVEISDDEFPRVSLVRSRSKAAGERFGPFTSAAAAREGLRVLREFFPFSTHPPERVGTYRQPCLDAQMGLCPGTCTGTANRKKYLAGLRRLKAVLRGRTPGVLRALERDLRRAVRRKDYERAAELRRPVLALRRLRDSRPRERPLRGRAGAPSPAFRNNGAC